MSESPESPQRPGESLRRELLAILFLYGVLKLLPLAIGCLFMPAGG